MSLVVLAVASLAVLSIVSAEEWFWTTKKAPQLELAYKPEEEEDVAWVGTLNGELHALDTRTGDILWTTDVGGSTIRSFQSMDSFDDGVVVPGSDGSIYVHSQGELKRFPLTIPDFVEQSPMFQVLPNGRRLTIVGSKTDKVFQLDAITGKVVRSFSSDGDDSSQPTTDTEPQTDQSERKSDNGNKILLVNRHDYRVRAFDEESGKEVWNFTFGVVDPISDKFAAPMIAADNQVIQLRAKSLLDRVRNVWRSPLPVSSAATGLGKESFIVAKSSTMPLLTNGRQPSAATSSSATVKRIILEDGMVQLYVSPQERPLPSPGPDQSKPGKEASKALTVFANENGDDVCAVYGKDQCSVTLGEHKVVPLALEGLGPYSNTSRASNASIPSNTPPSDIVSRLLIAALIMLPLIALYIAAKTRTPEVAAREVKTTTEKALVLSRPKVSDSELAELGLNRTTVKTVEDEAVVPLVNDNEEEQLLNDGGKKVGKLTVYMAKVKGYGGNGTIVVEGRFEDRPVAVKRMQSALYDRASKEIDFLIQSEGHSNVVRYLAKEETVDFVYLALELCEMTLDQAVEEQLKEGPIVDASQAWIPDDLRQFLAELTSATNHLHVNGIVHCDIKPQNVLVVPRAQKSIQEKTFGSRWIPKLSDMGLSRNVDTEQSSFRLRSQATHTDTKGNGVGGGTVGWRAPELLVRSKDKKSRLSRKVDVFSLGCVFYYLLHDGSHPFGEWLQRESHIVLGNPVALEKLSALFAESSHLIGEMIAFDPAQRPSTAACLSDPLLWPAKNRLEFVCDVSNRLEKVDPNSAALKDLELRSKKVFPGGGGWVALLEPTLERDVNASKHRKYDVTSFRDLLRYIRNKRHHFDEDPELSKVLSWDPVAFLRVFCTSFPELLPQTFNWALRNCGTEPKFVEVFGGHEVVMERVSRMPPAVDEPAASSSCRRKTHHLAEQERAWWISDWANDFPDLPPIIPPPSFNHKSMLCQHWERSGGQFCVMGSKCGFAHGLVELRLLPESSRPSTDSPQKGPSRLGNGNGAGRGSAEKRPPPTVSRTSYSRPPNGRKGFPTLPGS